MREIIKFLTNIPVEVTLPRGNPKPVEGRYGPQMMYTLADERVMYVPTIVADRIRELDVAPGERIEICKAEIKEGNRRWINWQVRRLNGDAQQAERQADAAAAPEESEGPSTPRGSTNGSANGSVRQSRFAADSDGALVPVPVAGAAVTIMETALNAAAEIARRVESRALLANHRFQFTSEDVRAIGLTMFIQAMRDGGVRWEP